jgi:protease I
MKKIVVFVDDLYEELELWVPILRLKEAGFNVVIAGPETGKTHPGKHGYPCKAEASIDSIRAADFDGAIIPGGFAPDKLRRDPHVLKILKESPLIY